MTSGKVVLVPSPIDDLSGTKVRPAVCLTEPIGPHRHIVVAFITSRVQMAALDTDVSVRAQDPDFEQTGLRVPSTLCLHRLMTIASPTVLRELGALSDSRLAEIRLRLRRLFHLDRAGHPQSWPKHKPKSAAGPETGREPPRACPARIYGGEATRAAPTGEIPQFVRLTRNDGGRRNRDLAGLAVSASLAVVL